MPIAFLVVTCLAGLVLGRILAEVAKQVSTRDGLAVTRISCAACTTRLASRRESVASWILLWGTCVTCGRRIPLRYLAVELGSAAAFLAMALRFGAVPALPAFSALAAVLVALAAIDISDRVVPRRLLGPALAWGSATLVLASATTGRWGEVRDGALGGLLAFAVFLLIAAVTRGGIGFGDVRLAGTVGVFLGWLGLPLVLLGLLWAFALAALVGLALVCTGRRAYRSTMPFVPYIAAGTLSVVLLGVPVQGLWRV